jgi:hypothetical protein
MVDMKGSKSWSLKNETSHEEKQDKLFLKKRKRMMSRYIIHCDNPEDITFGVKAIKRLMKEGFDDLLVEFEGSSIWHVKKTKTGYAAKLVGEE